MKKITSPSPKEKSKNLKAIFLRYASIAAAFVAMIVIALYNSPFKNSELSDMAPMAPENKIMAYSVQTAPQEASRKQVADTNNVAVESAQRKSIAGTSTTPIEQQKKIIQTANIQLSIVDYKEFLKRISDYLNKNAGYVENSNLYKDNQTNKFNADLAIRIPVKHFQSTIEFIRELGDLKSLNVNSQDMSMQYVDTAAKIKTYKLQITALQTMLGKATKVEEMLQVQNELTRVQAEHDSLVAQNQYIDRSADLATISLNVNEELSKEKVLPNQNNEVLNKAKSGFILSINNLIASIQSLFIGFVSLIPQLLIALTIIFIIVWFLKIKYKK